jgi:hypothetical protein
MGEVHRARDTKLNRDVAKIASDWSADGRTLLYRTGDPTGGNDIWALPMDGDRKPFLAVDSRSDAREG